MRPLFDHYPQLAERLAHQPICDLLTPVQLLRPCREKNTRSQALYVKRDDLSGSLFGGNKVRTLEFLLGAAHEDGGNIVSGLAGTSMALASNVYAHALKIPLKTLLIRQEPTLEAQQNLRYFYHLGADLEQIGSVAQIEAAMVRAAQEIQERFQRPPFWLNPSQPLGMCGYVNAAFELRQQVVAGVLPEPDRLYLPVGLLGTITGLTLGLKAAGLKTRVVGVLVPPGETKPHQEIRGRILELFGLARGFLREQAPAFPAVELTAGEIELRGPGPTTAAQSMEEAETWPQRWPELAELRWDATWTAPTFAALVRDFEAHRLDGQTILYWHTYNSRPYPPPVAQVDHTQLPQAFQA